MISIITAVYNRASTLEKTINSVKSQSFFNWELVVWDDGSTDNSLEVALSFKDPRIRVFSSQNQGYTKSLITAIAAAHGKYIGICDSDDWLHPNCLKLSSDALNSLSDVGMVFTDHYKVDNNDNIIELGKREHLKYSPMKMLVQNIPFHFRLWRRSLYDQLGGFNLEYPVAQDYEFNLRASEITQIHHLPELLYYYRCHPAQVSVQKRMLQIDYSEKAIREAITRRKLNSVVTLTVDRIKSSFLLEASD